MSYNTRNTRQASQGQGSGRGSNSGTTQIMYHQQQQGRTGQQSRLAPNNVSSSGYGQQSAVHNAPFSSQTTSTPAYTTQPKVYEYQNQQLPVAQTKVEPVTPSKEPEEEREGNTDGDVEMEEQPEETTKKPWMKKKVPGFKVNRRIKRRRQNARLRKILQPKNAIMVLNELKAGVKFTFHEQATALAQTSFVVNAEVDGKSHIGQGPSKPLAKQNAAENALKALLLEKMTLAAQRADNPLAEDATAGTAATTTDATGENNGDGSEEIDDLKPEDDDNTKPGAPEDEVPWGSLASFALFKLFTDWQNQGTHVPIAKATAAAATPAQPLKTAPMKQLPENPTDRHPVMLLSQMRPGCKFVEHSREGTAPNLTFTLSVTVDGVVYNGVAKNKKDAKKEAAKAALLGCLDIHYD